jgi:subtilisin family serine protease
MSIATLLALTLARCAGDNGPTGWIPRDASIAGTVTVAGGLLQSPALNGARVLTAQSRNLPFPAPPPLDIVPAHGLSTLPPRRPTIARSELIVTFRPAALGAPAVGSAALRDIRVGTLMARAMRARLAGVLPPDATVIGLSPAILAARVRVANRSRADAVASELSRDPAIASVTPDHLMWLDQTPYYRSKLSATAARTVPNNPLYPFQSWHYGLIDLPRAWTITTGSAAVLVAVVDDGMRFDHPAIAPNLTSDGYDFVSDADSLPLCGGGTITNAADGDDYDPDPTIVASYVPDSTGSCFVAAEFGNHGLHVAGTIGAAGNSGIGVTGVNWHVRIRPVRVLGVGGFGNSYDVAQGVLYAAGLPADNGVGGTVQAATSASIINLSLGGPGNDTTLQRAIVSATQAGALVVAAAGNANTSLPYYPAAYPEVLAVAAVGPDGLPAPYTNFGSYIGIRAPGGNFAFGDATDGVMSSIWDFGTNSPAYAWAAGTSMAAPHVAGVAALVLAQSPGLNASELRSRLTTYAVGPTPGYGAGIVNAYNSLAERHGPPTELHASLYAVSTGALVRTVAAQTGGAFRFTGVLDGTYQVYAGTDAGGDEGLGTPGMLWGAFGGPVRPTVVTVLGKVQTPVSFAIAFPQSASNHTLQTATPLVIGGYMQGRIVHPDTIDVFKVQIPRAATYTFQTSGWVGACGTALEEATAIGLFNPSGTLLTFTGYIDQAHYNYCSRLTLNLNAGTYYVAVAGLFGLRYRLQARAGP